MFIKVLKYKRIYSIIFILECERVKRRMLNEKNRYAYKWRRLSEP